MKRTLFALSLIAAPFAASADGLAVKSAYVPLSPPGIMAHTAYFDLTNTGDTQRRLVGVKADGYAMAHLHMSQETDGVATMAAMAEIEIAPGQTVSFAPGGLHVMLMHPKAPLQDGGQVDLVLVFANGGTLDVAAEMKRARHGS